MTEMARVVLGNESHSHSLLSGRKKRMGSANRAEQLPVSVPFPDK